LIITAGVPGAGKSSTLSAALTGEGSPFGAATTEEVERLRKGLLEIGTDKTKEEILTQNFTGANSALLDHEARDIAARTFKEALKRENHIVFDTTMRDMEGNLKMIKLAQEAGYEVVVIGTVVPPEVAISRASGRLFSPTARFNPPGLPAKAAEVVNGNLASMAARHEELGIRVKIYSNRVNGEPPRLLIAR
jgi:predicted ABC-type ATPase